MTGEVFQALILPAAGLDIALKQPLAQEGLHQLGIQTEHIGHQILQVDHLGAVIAQNLSKGVMLLLSNLEEGNVVKQKLSQRVWGKVQQLFTGAVQQHLFQRVDLASDINTFHGSSYSFQRLKKLSVFGIHHLRASVWPDMTIFIVPKIGKNDGHSSHPGLYISAKFIPLRRTNFA